MALQIELVTFNVSKMMDKLWNITAILSVTDESTEVLNKSFSTTCRTGQEAEEKIKRLLPDMQKAIDDYKSERQIKNSQTLVTAGTYLQNNLEV